jgi:hypothetical protein
MVAHTYCCGFNDFPEDWICAGCQELEVSESSEDYMSEEESE